jgi:hypothetical protein
MWQLTSTTGTKFSVLTDWEDCCWPSQLYVLGTPTHPYLWPVTDAFQLNVHWAAVQLCFIAFGIIHLLSVAFYVVRTAHKFDFRLVMKAVPNNWWPVERKSWSDRDLCFWQDIYIYIYIYISTRLSPGVSRDSIHALQINCVLLSEGQCLFWQAAKCVGFVAHAYSSHRVSAMFWANSWWWWWWWWSPRLRVKIWNY